MCFGVNRFQLLLLASAAVVAAVGVGAAMTLGGGDDAATLQANAEQRQAMYQQRMEIITAASFDEGAAQAFIDVQQANHQTRMMNMLQAQQEIYQVLTPEQQQKYQELSAKKMEKQQKRMQKGDKKAQL